MSVDMSKSPAPWEGGNLTDPIEIYDMIMVDDIVTQDMDKPDAKFSKRLIRHVRRHRELYDPAHKNFTNAEVRTVIWEKIAKKMNCDADQCKNAWVNLRYCYQMYVRRLRKFFANKITSKRRHRRPVMEFETEMIFLWRFIGDKANCRLPYKDDEGSEKDKPAAAAVADDDDLVLVEDDVEVIDLDDEANANNVVATFARNLKGQFLITPEIRRLITNIEPYEELYDCLNRYHDDYRRRGIIWNAIANEVGDKATKLMKCWIQIQTRYEWEVMQRHISGSASATKPQSELEHLLSFFEPHILKMPGTVYKCSYYLRHDWFEPIDHFKNIFSLLVAMKKYPTVISLTEGVATSFAEQKCVAVDEAYTKTWSDVAACRGGGVTPGQCETTWLILRAFYWELVNMRKHSYQLQDKWYFETIIAELYTLEKSEKSPRNKVMKQNGGDLLTLSNKATSSPPPPPPTACTPTPTPAPTVTPVTVKRPVPPTATSSTVLASSANKSNCNITIQLVEPNARKSTSNQLSTNSNMQQQQQLPKAASSSITIKSVTSKSSKSHTNNAIAQPPTQKSVEQTFSTFVPTPVNFDEDKISSSKIHTKLTQVNLNNNNTNNTLTNMVMLNPSVANGTNIDAPIAASNTNNLVLALTKAQQKTINSLMQQDTNNAPQQMQQTTKSPQIRVKSQAQLIGDQQPVNMLVQTHPQLQIRPQSMLATQQQQQQQQQQYIFQSTPQMQQQQPQMQQQQPQMQQQIQRPQMQQQQQQKRKQQQQQINQSIKMVQPIQVLPPPSTLAQQPTPQLQQTQTHYQIMSHPIIQQQQQQQQQSQTNTSATITTNMGQLLPPQSIEQPICYPISIATSAAKPPSTASVVDTIKTPKIVSAVSLAPRATTYTNKGLQITAVTSGAVAAAGGSGTPPPPQSTTNAQMQQPQLQTTPPPLVHASGITVRPAASLIKNKTLLQAPPTPTLLTSVMESSSSLSSSPSMITGTSAAASNNVINLPFQLPDNTNIMKCQPLSAMKLAGLSTSPQQQQQQQSLLLATTSNAVNTNNMQQPKPAQSQQQSHSPLSIEKSIPANLLVRAKPTPTAQLNPNEIMIELISSVNGNQLVVHGPPLERKYSLSMSTTTRLIREVLSIPYLHKKDYNKPQQINVFWQILAKRFNLPVHICKACWNFLSENFAHFPQIAPIEELTKPVKLGIKVWRETYTYFDAFNEKAAQLRLPQMKGAVEKFFDNIRAQAKSVPRVPGKKLQFVTDWRTVLTSKNSQQNKLWLNTWSLFRNSFIKYMRDLETGVDNKWSIKWWRVLAKLDFLLEEQYHSMEPFYYIVRNKMIAECERCIKEEQKQNAGTLAKKARLNEDSEMEDVIMKIPDIDPYRVIFAVRRYPAIYERSDEDEKNKAWEQVAAELQISVTSCRFAFQHALKNYRLFVARDPANRCRLNHRYYKHLAEICKAVKPNSNKKLNVKTPIEMNQAIGIADAAEAGETVFPERFVMDINMSNSSSYVVMKNWAYGLSIAGVSCTDKLEEIFQKYLFYTPNGGS